MRYGSGGNHVTRRRLLVSAVLPWSGLLLAGCGGAGQSSPAPLPTPTPAPSPTPTPTPTPAPTPTPTDTFNTAEYRRSDGVNYHGAGPVWLAGASGAGVTVAVIDSGVDADSVEFAGRIHPMSADVAGGARGFDDTGSDGHGTDVAQLLLGARNDRATVGMAFGATLLALRADRVGSCTDTVGTNADERGCRFADSAIAAGVDRAVSAGARIINISLGGSAPDANLIAAIQRATSAGIIIVVAAGNDGDSSEAGIDPANPDPFAQGLQLSGNGLVVIAGSNDAAGHISTFSNRAGTFANAYLLALGDDVCCVYENGDLKRDVRSDGPYVFLLNGTSFAAPQIAGAAALLAQAFPRLTGQQIVDLLFTSATDVGPSGTDATHGRGILNLARAFAPQGATSLAGTGIALPLNQALGGLSGPMGDAARRGDTTAVVLDGYGRAYGVALNGLLQPAAATPQLTASLAARQRLVRGQAGNSHVALTLTSGEHPVLPYPTSLSGQDDGRLLTASVMTRLSPRASLGFAFGTSAHAAATSGDAGTAAAFLVADPAGSLHIIGLRSVGGGSFRYTLTQGMGVSLAAERGTINDLRSPTGQISASELDRLSPYSLVTLSADSRHRLGGNRSPGSADLRLTARLHWLDESGSLLGARLSPALGRLAAQSVLLDVGASIAPVRGWSISGQWREGWTSAPGGGPTLAGASLRTRSWSVDLSHATVLMPTDRLSLRLAAPLRVTHGGLNLQVPTGFDDRSGIATISSLTLPLAPLGHERVAELAWSAPAWGGMLSINGYWRQQPGHIASAPDDMGAAVRFALGL